MEPEYIDVVTAARTLGLPVSWLRREVKAGRLPSIRAGRRLLVSPNELRDALRKGKGAADDA